MFPDQWMEMLRGYQPSRIFLSALELDAFTVVAGAGARATAEVVARGMGADAHGAEVLLDALVALGMLEKRAGVYANTAAAASHLVAGAPDDSRDALKHNLSLWSTWSTLTECVRAGHTVRTGDMASRGDDWTVPFIAAMHRNASMRAPLVVNAVGAGARRLLDVGGGSGAFAIAFAQAHPALEAEVLDLPTVLPITQRHIAEAGLEARVRTRAGDLRRDAFGSGYDLALLSAICHMLSPAENQDLLARLRAALVPGGRVVIQDHVMNVDKTAPRVGALFAINMLVGTPAGGTYSEEEYRRWLECAGFGEVCRIAIGGPNDLMVGTVT